MSKLKQIYTWSMVFSILLAVLSIFMILNPKGSFDVVCTILAVYAITKGLYLIVMHFKSIDAYLPVDLLLPGLLSVVIGVILFIKPNYLEVVVGILLGAWVITESIFDINISWRLRNTSAPWLLTIFLSLASLAAGIYLLFNPSDTADAFMMLSGVVLLISSISACVDKIIFKQYIKDIESSVKEALKVK